MISISVLGPVEVVRDGRTVPVPGGRTAELVVRLALDAGQVVRSDVLIDDLWGAEAGSTRRNTLQSKVARLRRALGGPEVVVSADGGYRLAVEPVAVDALTVAHQAVAAVRLLTEGEAAAAAELATAALARFGPELLPGAGPGDWVAPHRARLHDVRLSLVESRLSALVDLGNPTSLGPVIGELEAAVAVDPFRERLWELLLLAQYRAGRQADALATFQRVRTVLADELGLEPGPGLRKLEQQILTHDPSLGPPEGPSDGQVRGNLPALTVELVGREAELAAVLDRLAVARLVEIVGPGGVGKTALAIAAGQGVPGGGWLARLETSTTADGVVDTLVAAMNASGEAALFERLKGAGALVILDNCEHVLPAAADLAVRLLEACPGVRVLCTSQVPLGLDGGLVVELAPLAEASAVELFTRRASAGRLGRGPEHAAALHALCRSLDGLPLAIELAAARTRTLSIEEISRRLDDRFRLLTDPTSRRPERRRELRSTIRWSYDLLFPDDQRGLWALAIFAGGAPLAAVEYVVEALDVPAPATIDVVSRLESRSLVIVDGDDAAAPVRYRLLDSIRAFAREELAAAGLAERAQEAHAAWFAAQAARSTPGVRSGHQAEHLALARTERANIDAALAWSIDHDPPRALDIAIGFGWSWVVLGDSRGARRILAAVSAAGDGAPPQDRTTALLLAAWLEASTDDLELARRHIDEATRLADQIGDVDLQARACHHLAYVVSHHGQFRQALELTDRSDALLQGRERPWEQATNWLFAARAAISAGDVDRAVAARDQVEHWLAAVDDPWLAVRHEAMLGELARLQHRFDDAVVHIARAVDTSARLGFQQTGAYQTFCLGRAYCQAGDYERGAATLHDAVAKAEATGDLRMAALARVHLGRVLRALGRDDAARDALEAAAAWHRSAGGGEQAALGNCLLAAMEADHPQLDAILQQACLDRDAHVEVLALDALALLAARNGDPASARSLYATADDRMAAASHFITERDRTDRHRVPPIPEPG